MSIQVGKRLDSMENRFEGRFASIDGRFAQIDGSFAQIDQWITTILTIPFRH